MNRIYIVGSVLILVILAAGLYLYLRSPASSPQNTAPYTNPYSYTGAGGNGSGSGTATKPGGATSSDSNQTTLAIPGGNTLEVRNFLKDSDVGSNSGSSGVQYLGNHINPADPNAPVPQYVIEYDASTSYFNIALLKEPISAARLAAEQYLMAKLGITKGQMCSLTYMVTTPNSVDPTYAGTSLGFSFCPGAVQLP